MLLVLSGKGRGIVEEWEFPRHNFAWSAPLLRKQRITNIPSLKSPLYIQNKIYFLIPLFWRTGTVFVGYQYELTIWISKNLELMCFIPCFTCSSSFLKQGNWRFNCLEQSFIWRRKWLRWTDRYKGIKISISLHNYFFITL